MKSVQFTNISFSIQTILFVNILIHATMHILHEHAKMHVIFVGINSKKYKVKVYHVNYMLHYILINNISKFVCIISQ